MKIVKISNEKPPQWILDEVKEKWNVEWESGVVFTYGELITTFKGEVTEDLIAHESHHTAQHEKFGGADKWWREYLDNADFRFEQELECYRKQYKWLVKNIKNRQERFYFTQHYARSLSSEMYGNITTYQEAYKLITE